MLKFKYLAIGVAVFYLTAYNLQSSSDPEGNSTAVQDIDVINFVTGPICEAGYPVINEITTVNGYTTRNHGVIDVEIGNLAQLHLKSVVFDHLGCPFYYLNLTQHFGGYVPVIDPTAGGKPDQIILGKVQSLIAEAAVDCGQDVSLADLAPTFENECLNEATRKVYSEIFAIGVWNYKNGPPRRRTYMFFDGQVIAGEVY